MAAHLLGEEGPLQGLLLPFSEGEEWVLGRDPDLSNLILEDPMVSRRHARVTKTDEGFYLENLSEINPALVNGEERQEKVLLQEGDHVQIGQTTFLFSEKQHTEKKPLTQGGYDDIFGDLEEPPPPPGEEEEVEPTTETSQPEAEAEETPYDTIFEDTSSEEELPLNLLPSTPLVLKVISGPNAGAEIGLEKGRIYTIGKDANSCDITFQDLSVSREHARLSVSEEGTLTLEDLGSKNGTLVNGVALAEKKVVTPQDVIAVGTTVFLVIDREAPQETIYSPAMPVYEAPQPETAPLESMEEGAAVGDDWKKRPLPTKHLVVGASLLFISLVIFISFFSLFKAERMMTVEKQPQEHIQEALQKFQAVQFSFNPASGKLFLVGHVVTPVDFQELNYQISQFEFIRSVENNVVIDELVCKMNNDVLSTNPAWRSVSIQTPQAGQFVATGYLPTNQENGVLAEYLTVNFPYLDRLQNQVMVEENLNTQIQSLLAKNGLGAVTYQLANGEVILSGRYSYKMDREFEGLLKTLNALPGVTRVANFALSASPDAASIDLSSQYVVSGTALQESNGYSAVLNGKIYTVGAVVDGMQITAIQSNRILLEKDGLKYKIDYIPK